MRPTEERDYKKQCDPEKDNTVGACQPPPSVDGLTKYTREKQIDLAAENFIRIFESYSRYHGNDAAKHAIQKITEAAMWAKKALEV